MIAQVASVGLLGFDTVTILDKGRCDALYGAGFRFAVRYLGGLTSSEAATIFASGLQLSFVTYSRVPGWIPTPGMGTTDGAHDVGHLKQIGAPVGATVWIDLEGVGAADTADIAAWVNERAAVLRSAGYDPGLYVGAGGGLSAAELYSLAVDRYWRSLSQVPEPACGWSMLQLSPTTTSGGTAIDVNVIQGDFRGRYPVLAAG